MTESANESQMESLLSGVPRRTRGVWGLVVAALLGGVLIGFIGHPYLDARLPQSLHASIHYLGQA